MKHVGYGSHQGTFLLLHCGAQRPMLIHISHNNTMYHVSTYSSSLFRIQDNTIQKKQELHCVATSVPLPRVTPRPLYTQLTQLAVSIIYKHASQCF